MRLKGCLWLDLSVMRDWPGATDSNRGVISFYHEATGIWGSEEGVYDTE